MNKKLNAMNEAISEYKFEKYRTVGWIGTTKTIL